MKKYAGIGSRATPMHVLAKMREFAAQLEKIGYECHTGGALGADKAFIDGATNTQIWLPFHGYNGYSSNLRLPNDRDIKFASKYHPKWESCGHGARLMHARNCSIVLGDNLDEPVDFIICWTQDGKPSGGTGQALRIALHYEIPVFNLGRPGDEEDLRAFIDQLNSLN